MLPLGEWTPDRVNLATGSVQDVANCAPQGDAWGPYPSYSVISTALGDVCKGAVTVRAGSSYVTIAGTATKLYRYDSGTSSWVDKSGGTTFAVPDGDFWSFALYGNFLLATNANNGLYEIDLTSSGNFSPTAGSPPRARFVDIVGDFVVLGCITGTENRIQWSGLNDRTQWTVGTNFADYQDFPDGGSVRGLSGYDASGIIFQEDTVRRMSLVGGALIFQFDVVARSRVIRSPWSIVKQGPRTYASMTAGFFVYEAGAERPIGLERVDDWFASRLDSSWSSRTLGAFDPTRPHILWAFRSADNAGAYYDQIIGYDWFRDRWFRIEQNLEYLFPAATVGYTLENLDAFGSLDTLAYSLDSAAWGGGQAGLGVFDTAHRFGFQSGPSMQAVIVGAEQQFVPSARAFVSEIVPVTDAPTLTVAVGTRETLTNAVSYGPEVALSVTGATPQRASGRYHTVRCTVPAAATWAHVQAYDARFRKQGLR